MSKEIQKTQSLAVATIDDVARVSKIFYESGMFSDLKSMAQAGVKIMAGSELGITPFQAISGVHVIKGKAVIGAGLMASMLDSHPEYDFEVLQQTDKICEIKFFKNGKVRGISKFTIEDAQKAGTQNINKFPANMLYARAMSNGVKFYAPGLFSGPVYVPEEMQQEEQKTHDTTYTEVKSPKMAEDKSVQASMETIEQIAEQQDAVTMASDKQMQLISNLYNSHHVPDEIWGGDELTQEEASALIDTMTDLIAKGTEYEKSTPATAEQVEDIEILLDNTAFTEDERQKGKDKLKKGYSIAQAKNVIAKLEKMKEERSQVLANG